MNVGNIKSAKYHHIRNPDDLTEIWDNNKIVFTMNDDSLVCYTKTFAEDADANPEVAVAATVEDDDWTGASVHKPIS